MRILVLGGTQFVGRHFVEAALAAGHDLTLVHRGKTGADLFPQCKHVLTDRLKSLEALGDDTWDALVDVSAYVPRAVKIAGEALGTRVDYLLQVSTISVYAGEGNPVTEESAKATLSDPTTEEINWETYGGLKYLCELEAERHFAKVGFVRPTYVVGPYDHTKRFTHWVDRLARNKPVEVPVRSNGQAGPIQRIDGRDLADFMLKMVEQKLTGPFNACADSQEFLEVLDECRTILNSSSDVVKVSERAEDKAYPLLPPLDGAADAMMNTSNAKAVAAGLTFRPLSQTVNDLWAWWQTQGEELGD